MKKMELSAWKAKRKLSLTALSELVDVPAPVLSRFFRGHTTLSPKYMAKVVLATRGVVSFDSLISEGERRKSARDGGAEVSL